MKYTRGEFSARKKTDLIKLSDKCVVIDTNNVIGGKEIPQPKNILSNPNQALASMIQSGSPNLSTALHLMLEKEVDLNKRDPFETNIKRLDGKKNTASIDYFQIAKGDGKKRVWFGMSFDMEGKKYHYAANMSPTHGITVHSVKQDYYQQCVNGGQLLSKVSPDVRLK